MSPRLPRRSPAHGGRNGKLQLLARTEGPILGAMAGLVGALVSAGFNAIHKAELAERLADGNWFSRDVADRLILFLQANNREMTVG